MGNFIRNKTDFWFTRNKVLVVVFAHIPQCRIHRGAKKCAFKKRNLTGEIHYYFRVIEESPFSTATALI